MFHMTRGTRGVKPDVYFDHALMLADVSLQDMKCTSLTVDDTKWTVVVSGKVAIAMGDTLAQS